MTKKTLKDCPRETLTDQVVVVRVDYNLPLDPNGEVVENTRLVRTLPTIQYLVEAGAKAVLLSHLGRPGGRPDPALSLRPLAGKLEEVLGSPVDFCAATTGPLARDAVQRMERGDVLLLENTRFCPEDRGNDAAWAEEISFGSKLFINDAFGTAHRTHASTKGIADAVRAGGGEAVAGFLLEKELRFLCDAIADPEHPFVAIIGGAKISSKIDAIEALLRIQERLPRSELAERAAIEVMDYYYRTGQLTLATTMSDIYLTNYPRGQRRVEALVLAIRANIALYRGPTYDGSSLLDARVQIRRLMLLYPIIAEQEGLGEAQLHAIDEAGADQLFDTARWYLKRGDPPSARYTLRRLVRKHPRSQAAAMALELMRSRGWQQPEDSTADKEQSPQPDAPNADKPSDEDAPETSQPNESEMDGSEADR